MTEWCLVLCSVKCVFSAMIGIIHPDVENNRIEIPSFPLGDMTLAWSKKVGPANLIMNIKPGRVILGGVTM